MINYEITSLYTEIPVKITLEAFRNELKTDHELNKRTKFSIEKIMSGIQLCPTSNLEDLNKEFKHIKEILLASNYPPDIIKKYVRPCKI